jgi:hypothetical protein
MVLIKNPIRSILPYKELTLEEKVIEAINDDSIQVDIPRFEQLYISGPTKEEHLYNINNPLFQETKRILYDINCKFHHPKISDMAILTSGGFNKNVYVKNNYRTVRDINHLDNYLGRPQSICYIDENGSPKVSDKNAYCSRNLIIQPVFSFERCPKLFNLLTHGGKDEYIYFGEAPIYAAPANIQDMLTGAFKKNKVVRIMGDYYTYDGTPVHGKNSHKKRLHKVNYPVYEYDGKHYIRYKITQLDKDIYKFNNKTYKNGDYIWIEVSPLLCKVNKDKLALICEEGIMGGIQFANPNDRCDTIYASSFVHNYLKPTILQHPKHFLYKKYEKEDKQEEPDEISILINQIKTYRKYYFGKENVDDKVKKLLNDFNKKLDEVEEKNKAKSPQLVVGEYSPSLLHKTLILDLNDVLNTVKAYYEKNKNYFDMIDILEMCKGNDIDPTKDSLCAEIYEVKSTYLGLIKDRVILSELDNELRDLIDKHITLIKSYIINEVKPIKSINELKENFRADISVWRNAAVITSLFKEAGSGRVKAMVDDINKVSKEIEIEGTSEEINKAKQLTSLIKNMDLSQELNIIYKNLNDVLMLLYKIQYDINERRNSQNEINKYRPKVDPNTIFDDEPPRYASMR